MTYAKIGQYFAPNEIDSKFVTSVKQLFDFDPCAMRFVRDQMIPCVLVRKNSKWALLSIAPYNFQLVASQNTKIEPDTLVYWV